LRRCARRSRLRTERDSLIVMPVEPAALSRAHLPKFRLTVTLKVSDGSGHGWTVRRRVAVRR
jgi:hypothetical protein